jgi:hypothetical protein
MIEEDGTSASLTLGRADKFRAPIRRAPWSPEVEITYRLIAYDRESRRPVMSYAVPSPLVNEVKRIAGFRSDDDGLGDYSLDTKQISEIGLVLQIKVEPNRFDYLIEPYVRERAGDTMGREA